MNNLLGFIRKIFASARSFNSVTRAALPEFGELLKACGFYGLAAFINQPMNRF